jgi:hypothetical protein
MVLQLPSSLIGRRSSFLWSQGRLFSCQHIRSGRANLTAACNGVLQVFSSTLQEGEEETYKSKFGHSNTDIGSVLKVRCWKSKGKQGGGWVQLEMPRAPQHRKRRKPYVYLDPSRFTCTACRASFKSAAGLKRHCAQRRICQPDSDSDADSSVENTTFPDLYLDADNIETFGDSLDIGGGMEEGARMHEPEHEPEVSNTLNTESGSRPNTAIPSDPSRIEDIFEEQYPGAGCVISHGMTPFQYISSTPSYKDAKSSNRVIKACYPFKDPEEVEIVDWLLRNRLSKASIDEFVKTKYVSGMLMITLESLIHALQISAQVKGTLLSFKSAYTLHRRLDELPRAGPVWKTVTLSPKTGTPKEGTPPVLFYRDPIGAVQYLLSNPALQEGIRWSPRKVFEDEGKTRRLFSDMSTGDWWWDTQVRHGGSS